MRLGEQLRQLSSDLSHVSDAPHADAERLLLHIFKKRESSWLYSHSDSVLTERQLTKLASLLERRLAGEPLAYLTGEWDFYGRTFTVTPDVLIPRPETEVLVERALTYLHDHEDVATTADVGTGSGCIAVTLAIELGSMNKEVVLLATDISPAALKVAHHNAQRHDVADRITFVHEDITDTLQRAAIDLIVSNPPYVPSVELSHSSFHRDTRGLAFEPKGALDGGSDGTTFTTLLKNTATPAFFEARGGIIAHNRATVTV